MLTSPSNRSGASLCTATLPSPSSLPHMPIDWIGVELLIQRAQEDSLS